MIDISKEEEAAFIALASIAALTTRGDDLPNRAAENAVAAAMALRDELVTRKILWRVGARYRFTGIVTSERRIKGHPTILNGGLEVGPLDQIPISYDPPATVQNIVPFTRLVAMRDTETWDEQEIPAKEIEFIVSDMPTAKRIVALGLVPVVEGMALERRAEGNDHDVVVRSRLTAVNLVPRGRSTNPDCRLIYIAED